MVPLHVTWLPLLIIYLIFSIFFYRLHGAIHECSYSGMKINMTQHYTLRTGNEIIEITKLY